MLVAHLSEQFAKNKPRFIEQHRKLAIKLFERSGFSSHSGMAMLLPFIINYCEENRIPYKLIARPGMGYYVEREKAE